MQSSKLYIGNFDYSTVGTQLEKLFSPFGQIVSVAVIDLLLMFVKPKQQKIFSL